MWHDSYIRVTWHTHICVTCPPKWVIRLMHRPPISVPVGVMVKILFVCITWLFKYVTLFPYTCDMTHPYVCDMTHPYVCDMTHPYVSYDSYAGHPISLFVEDVVKTSFLSATWLIQYVTWLTYTCDMTHPYVCDMTHRYVSHDSYAGPPISLPMEDVAKTSFLCVTWLIQYVTWLTYTCDMTHPYVCNIAPVWRLLCDMTYRWHTHSCVTSHSYVWQYWCAAQEIRYSSRKLCNCETFFCAKVEQITRIWMYVPLISFGRT